MLELPKQSLGASSSRPKGKILMRLKPSEIKVSDVRRRGMPYTVVVIPDDLKNPAERNKKITEELTPLLM
jgi:hypothetical protein